MIQIVARARGDEDVALRVVIGENLERDLRKIVNVHVRVHDDDRFGEHHQAHTPQAIHHLARVSRITFLDADDYQIMEHAFGGHVDVYYFAEEKFDQRQEQPLGGFAHPVIFHRRLADNRRRVNRRVAVRDRRNVHDRIIVGNRVIAGVIAKRSFDALFARVHVPFDNNLRVRRNLNRLRNTADEVNRLAAQPARQHHLVNIRRQRRGTRPDDRGIAAERYADRDALRANIARDAFVLRAAFLTLPVHSKRLIVQDLEAIHADVAPPGFWIAAKDRGERDIATGVFGPALNNRQRGERGILLDNLLASSLADDVRLGVAHRVQHLQPALGFIE